MDAPRVYLDYNATTPVDPRVLSKMREFLAEACGNPSSRDHVLGWEAAEAVEEARSLVARLINANSSEIVFTSGATEGINWALKGLAQANAARGATLLTCLSEHAAVLECCRQIERTLGAKASYLPVNRLGHLDLTLVQEHAQQHSGTLMAFMLANNEIGTLHAFAQLAGLTRQSGAVLLTDLAQAAGKVPIDVQSLAVDLAAFSAHKLYGPKGVGALFIRNANPRIDLEPLIVGGGQERGLRGGTLNVPGIVGFGEACRIASLEGEQESKRVGGLRDRLEAGLTQALPDIWINGDGANRLSNTSNIGFRGVDARTLIRDLHDIAVSTRSACSSGDARPSHVLKAIGLTDDEAYSCIRFSLGRFTTEQEIDYTIGKVIESVRKLRSLRHKDPV